VRNLQSFCSRWDTEQKSNRPSRLVKSLAELQVAVQELTSQRQSFRRAGTRWLGELSPFSGLCASERGQNDSVRHITLSWWYHRRCGTRSQEVEDRLSQSRGRLRLSRFQTGPNVGDWFVVVQYANETAYEQAQVAIAQDPECQQAFAEIAKFAKRISREMVIDLDL
jgi:hypothetical protein